MNKDLIKQVVLEMIEENEIQIETYIANGNYNNEIVTVIATNLGEFGYKILAENRQEVNIDNLSEKLKNAW